MMSTLSQTCVVGRAEVEQQRALRHFGGHRVARRVPACTITTARSPPKQLIAKQHQTTITINKSAHQI
jgi:hypothetical protein